MRASKPVILISYGLFIVILVAAVQFFFNPLGLGPEPETVLSSEFFAKPAQDLAGLELLIEGRDAFNRILGAVDSAASSIYIQTYIWKDDTIGM